MIKKFQQFNENTEQDKPQNYMFFENLKTINRYINELLQLDEKEVDNLLKNGHDWAEEHISGSKENIEQVYNFLKNRNEN